MDRLRESRWDLLLLDINMPDRNGLDILKHVRSGFPDTRVLVLSGYPERQYARNVLRAGASGYLANGFSLRRIAARGQNRHPGAPLCQRGSG